jgi:hypothetical protein
MNIRLPLSGVGVAYVILGILGFAVGGFHDFVSEEGTKLVILEVTPFVNVVHLALGAALLRSAAQSEQDARRGALLGGAVLTALGLFGPALEGSLAGGTGEHILHVTTGVSALALWGVSARGTRRAPLAQSDR